MHVFPCQAFFGFPEIGRFIEEPLSKSKRLSLPDSLYTGRPTDSDETLPRGCSARSLGEAECLALLHPPL